MDDRDLQLIKAVAAKNGITEFYTPEKFTSGQINRVYGLNRQYVLKVDGGMAIGNFDHQPDITEKLLALGAKVPKLYDFGEINGVKYLLMERIAGKNLVYDWAANRLSQKQKESYMEQISEQLQLTHAVHAAKYQVPIYYKRPFSTFLDAITNVTKFSLVDKDKLAASDRKDFEFLQSFFEKNKHILDNQGDAVLIHNDLHFENVFVENGQVSSIIDWDWACYAPKDYEIWKIVECIHTPADYIEEKFQAQLKDRQFLDEFELLRKYYPSLFEAPYLKERIGLYHLDFLLETIADVQKGRWSDNVMVKVRGKIQDFYKNDWLDRILA